jgi:acetoin utilization deacetylase AcuC-like enzyme
MLRDLPRLGAEAVDDDELLRVHDAAHLAHVAALCAAGGGHFDADTYATAASDIAARVAAGGAVRAVEAVVTGEFDASFAVLRPPGHHATVNRAMGFCLYNNVAVAVQHARHALGVGHVAIVDIDVHHGNGSEATFWNDPEVLYTSLHQYPFYPGTGAAGDRGGPQASGLTVNVPLPAGTDGASWLDAFDEAVLPPLRAFEPELVVVSCGFDAHRDDPLAELLLDTQTYAAIAERLVALGALPSGAHTAWVLEGGYDLEALAESTQAVLEVLSAA